MRKIVWIIGVCIFILNGFTVASAKPNIEGRQRQFNSDWKFINDSLISAESPAFDDSKWRTVDLPHDFAIEDLEIQNEDQIGPFKKMGKDGNNSGYLPGGTGWYRKHFTIDRKDQGKIVQILFDGVMMASDVWINGKHLGSHTNGYFPFAYDLTPYLAPAGQQNVLAVRAKNDIYKTSRWYSGAGIYRNVNLMVTNDVHVGLWGVHVTTPEVSKEKATVNLAVTVRNNSKTDTEIKLETRLIGSDGKVSATVQGMEKIEPNKSKDINQTFKLDNPRLWSPESPDLYTLEVNVIANGKTVDTYTSKTGIRSIGYDSQKGFQINGKSIKLKGGCVHHDNGILGAVAIRRAEERKIEILKANGFNAIRTSHNPVSAEFLEICDRLGMLVLEEAFDVWTEPKRPDDYHIYFKEQWQNDLESMILRDRNHPSIVIWSVGNEIPERGDSIGLKITKQLVAGIRKNDTSRPITAAINPWLYSTPKHPWEYAYPIFEELDIAGNNYNWQEWEKYHQKYPEKPVLITESYPVEMNTVWEIIDKNPWAIGDFVWTAMDYLGEAGVGTSGLDNETNYMARYGNFISSRTWPWFNAWCGDIDLVGNKKMPSYYRDVVWNRTPMAMAVHSPIPEGRKELISKWGWPDELISWTWPGEEGKELEVTVYSKCTSVRLELNGKVIGEEKVKVDPLETIKPLSGSFSGVSAPTQLSAKFRVPYVAGELKAVGLVNGKEVVTLVLKTAGAPSQFILTPDRSRIKADRNDLAYVTVEVADENGNVIPNANVPFEVEISGNGESAAIGNASPDQMESFQDKRSKLFHGKAMIIVRPFEKTGKIKITATSKGIASKTIEIDVKD